MGPCAVTTAHMVRLKGVPWNTKVNDVVVFLSDITLEAPRTHLLFLNDRAYVPSPVHGTGTPHPRGRRGAPITPTGCFLLLSNQLEFVCVHKCLCGGEGVSWFLDSSRCSRCKCVVGPLFHKCALCMDCTVVR